MPQNDKTADATCVFRVPSSDVTVPDLMANVRITAPVLSIVKGPQTGAAFELEDDVTTIGRDPANGIFLNDMTVSRSHARIIREGLGARIEDLAAQWHLVDGAIVNAAPLHDGSSVQIGTFTLIYHEHAGAHRNR
ncbi:MAG: FHA domain-containing protein [Collinsella aerofaciens]